MVAAWRRTTVALGRHITMEVNGVEGWKSKISKILV
jgi:hypothetical protein